MSSGGIWVLAHNCAERAVASEENGNSTGYPSNSAQKSKNILSARLQECILHTAKNCLKCTYISKCLHTLIYCNIVHPVDDLWKKTSHPIVHSTIFRLSTLFILYHLSACPLSLLEMLQDFFLAVLSAPFKKNEKIVQGVYKG